MADQLPSGRWRARVRTLDGRQVSAATIIGGPATHPDEQTAEAAEALARDALLDKAVHGITVREWWETWTTDPMWARLAESTNMHRRERTKAFTVAYGDRLLRSIDPPSCATGSPADTTARRSSSSARCGTTPAVRSPAASSRRIRSSGWACRSQTGAGGSSRPRPARSRG